MTRPHIGALPGNPAASAPGDTTSAGASGDNAALESHRHAREAYGSSAGTVTQGNDARLSDARTPTAHATSHKSGGSDPIKLDELAATTDVTTLNASTSAHGLLKKLSNTATEYMNGAGNWAVPAASVAFVTLAKWGTD